MINNLFTQAVSEGVHGVTLATIQKGLTTIPFFEMTPAMVCQTAEQSNNVSITTSELDGGVPLDHRQRYSGSDQAETLISDTTSLFGTKQQTAFSEMDFPSAKAAWVRKDLQKRQGMFQNAEQGFWYGNNFKNHRQIHGFAARYNAISEANNVLSAGGVGSQNCSIYLIELGGDGAHILIPKGGSGKMIKTKVIDKDNSDANGNSFPESVKHYQLQIGLQIFDWQRVVRIANIDKNTSRTGSNVLSAVNRACDLVSGLPNSGGQWAWFMPSRARSILNSQIQNANNVRFGKEEVMGRRVDTFDNKAIFITEQLLTTEAVIPAA